ncbi:MMPL family transporter [Mycobacterium intracellulare]|uniref:MMPL family transporter n=1 Tax=Mycobacterium intracellulare TaxID=1767 RepID=A0AAE4RIN1_MYCIT|nr:MMPL family transporter [Mycobacterium intracellulare]MCA2321322.1 MMPL family transporter [Mycobacterium intracellulare]MCA2341854.1 MMPL family transporter [Mycobacterium intracellulare]MDV6979373.1 MMPL family transporter [Mycobacterium intracellulare]MDV6984784.1 MMPL family transporter [Mycobacterium intracellulare]MDV7014888.1 MMPL family transporter [Mycobacterium intracellulare]
MTTVSHRHPARPFIPHLIRVLSVPIILFWVFVAIVVNVVAPQLEEVGEKHAAPMTPTEALSTKASKRLGEVFKEYDSNTTVMVLLEGQKPLGDAAHRYYDHLVDVLSRDKKHVQHVQNFWGDPLTAAGNQSSDAKAAYVLLNIAGNQGESLANESTEAVRDVVEHTPAPDGVKAYVTGPGALNDDLHVIADASLVKITLITIVAIGVMLLLVYRSLATALIQLGVTLLELRTARGVVAVLGEHNVFGLTTFAANILVMLAIAAGTDYGIFLIGRYQEMRKAGHDREPAYYMAFRGISPVILGSGLTIAGATYCLRFTRLPYFQTMGEPVAIGTLVVVAAALTLGPAVLTVASRFGLLEPKRAGRGRYWRRIGVAVVRWPAPILVAALGAVLVGVLALPGFKVMYTDRYYLPADAGSVLGYQASDRHFSPGRMDPDILMIEADHDMRNTTDMLVLDKVAKNIIRVVGNALIQDITRPLGRPIQHSSVPFQLSSQSQTTLQNMQYLKDQTADMLKTADEQQFIIDSLQRQYDIQKRLADATHRQSVDANELTAIIDQLRDHLADFDDFFRPVRSYFYWEKHCYDIPICYAFRSLFDSLDSTDQLAEKFHDFAKDIADTDILTPQNLALIPPMIDSMKISRALTLTSHSIMASTIAQMDAMANNAIVMGQSFDNSLNDELFYLPPEAFGNPEFQRGLVLFLSPDGTAARFFITPQGDPATAEGITRVDPEQTAAHEALKSSSLADAKVYLSGTAATDKDLSDGAKYDLMIAVLSALTLIFIIMVILTRSVVAALVIVGTAATSISAAVGLSVLIWQDIVGLRLFWAVVVMSVVILLAVGADYNLLLVSRIKEELHHGLKTGMIRAMAGTGGVVTSAGLVFAFTMGSLVFSQVRIIGQLGTTIMFGLLLDTLVVRSFLMPSLATLLGRWFWWPQVVHPRGADNLEPRDRLTDDTAPLALASEH